MRIILILILSGLPLMSSAQYAQTIRSGRPGQSIGAFAIGKNVLQFQSGFTFGWDIDAGEALENHGVVFTNVIRYGIYERFEISGLIGLSNNRMETGSSMEKRQGLSAAQLGFRVNLSDGHGNVPIIALQSRARLNILSQDYHQKRLGNTTIISLSQKLSPLWGMGANLGITWNGNDTAPRGFYTLNLNTEITPNINVFVENYGDIADRDFDTRFDTGMGFIVTPDIQLDFSFGYGKNDGIKDYFVDFGVSWRLLTKDRSLEKPTDGT